MGDPHICNLDPFCLPASFLPPSPLGCGAWVFHLEPGERHKPLCRFLSALLRFAASPQRVSINTEGEQKEVITAIQTACKLSRSSSTSLPASHTQPGARRLPRPDSQTCLPVTWWGWAKVVTRAAARWKPGPFSSSFLFEGVPQPQLACHLPCGV